MVINTVHECRDLWADPPAWQAHLMRRACALSGSRIGIILDKVDHAGWTADRILDANDVGWESGNERRTIVDGLANRPLRYSPAWANFADLMAVRDRTRGPLTAEQDRFIDWQVWRASEMYDRHIRPSRLGRAVLSAAWLPQLSAWNVWSISTDRGDPHQSSRQIRLLRLLHGRIAPLIGTTLTTWRDRHAADLSPTRRAVLAALLDGSNEADIAEQSYRSRSAVHEHVMAIYRHFGVGTRGELAAYFLRRRPAPADRTGGPWTPAVWYARAWADAGRGEAG